MKFNNKILVFLSLTSIFASNAFAYKFVGAYDVNPSLTEVHNNLDDQNNYSEKSASNNDNYMDKHPVSKPKKSSSSKLTLYKKIILKEKLKNILKKMSFEQKIKFLNEQKKVQEKLEIEDIKFNTQLLEYKIQLLNNRLKKLSEIPYQDLKNQLYIFLNDPTVIVKRVDYNKIVQGQNDKLLLRYLLAKDLGLVNETVKSNINVSRMFGTKNVGANNNGMMPGGMISGGMIPER